jgi:hypothetical protein
LAYNRGYDVEGRGPYSTWTCLRTGCEEKGTARGDQHEDNADWAAAAHQQAEHRDELLRDAAAALQDAASALGPLAGTLTWIDPQNHPAPACIRPRDAEVALRAWASQVSALRSSNDLVDLDFHKRVGLRDKCKHETTNHTSTSWMVLMGLAEVGSRANTETPRD